MDPLIGFTSYTWKCENLELLLLGSAICRIMSFVYWYWIAQQTTFEHLVRIVQEVLVSNIQKTTFRSSVQFCIFPMMSSCHRQIMFLSIPNLQKLLQELDSFLLLEVEVLGTDNRCRGLTLSWYPKHVLKLVNIYVAQMYVARSARILQYFNQVTKILCLYLESRY